MRIYPIVENKKAGLPFINPGEAGAGLCLVAPKDRTNTNVCMRVRGAVECWCREVKFQHNRRNIFLVGII